MRYKIITVKFPFVGQKGFKVRPALCLTEPEEEHQNLIVAAISSKIDKQSSADILIDKKKFKNTGLKKNSLVKLNRLATVNVNNAVKELGHLPKQFEKELKQKLGKLFGIL